MKAILLIGLALLCLSMTVNAQVCVDPDPLGCPSSVFGSNATGLFNQDSYCGNPFAVGYLSSEKVYIIEPTQTQLYTITLNITAGDDLDFFMLTDVCDNVICVDDSDQLTPDIFTAELQAGMTYYLVVDGAVNAAGEPIISEFTIDVECTSLGLDCDGIEIECDETISSTTGGNSNNVSEYSCSSSNSSGLTGPETVFYFDVPKDGDYIFSLENFSSDLDLFILFDNCDPDDCIASTDASSSNAPDVTPPLTFEEGDFLYLVVDGEDGIASSFDLTVSCPADCEAGFEWTEECGKVSFQNTSKGTGLSYLWTIDGVTYTEENPCIEFTASGTITAILEISSEFDECSDTFEQQIEVEICLPDIFCECCPDGPEYSFTNEVGALPPSNTVQNGWETAYGNPVYNINGFGDNGCLELHSPSFGPGSAAQLSESGIIPVPLFQEGQIYCLSYRFRLAELGGLMTDAGKVILRATNSQLINGNCNANCQLITESVTINKSDGWQQHQFLWTATSSYDRLVLSTFVASMLDGPTPMLVDDICISEYTESCQARFAISQVSECGQVDLISDSCGDNITETWLVNSVPTPAPIQFAIPGTYTVQLSVTGADGCMDTITDQITVTAPPSLTLECPMSSSVSGIDDPTVCFYEYTVPQITTSVNASISCSFNGSLIQQGQIIVLNAGINNFVCTAVNECDEVSCEWSIEVGCVSESSCIEDFEEPEPTGFMSSLDNWKTVNGRVAYQIDPTSTLGTQVLAGFDGSGSSFMGNDVDFSGNWLTDFGPSCNFCFDIRYDNGDPANPSTGSNAIQIFTNGPPGNVDPNAVPHARFIVNNSIGNTWRRVCVPIALSSGGVLPSNSEGGWSNVTAVGFDNIIQNVSAVSFSLDFGGGSSISEQLFVDNLCFEECQATKDECLEDFEDSQTTALMSSVDNWKTQNGRVAYEVDGSTNGTQVLVGSDGSGSSWMGNTVDFSGDWLVDYGACEFCFDIRYDGGSPQNPSAGINAIYIYENGPVGNIFPPSGTFSRFAVVNPIGNNWTRVCVPIELSSGGVLPSNSYGSWTAATPAQFDNIIQNVDGISFPLDFASGSNITEKVYVDNFCFEECVCPPTEVNCDSLMVMSNPLELECFDASPITGNPCVQIFDPVCGCDGETYNNSCEARESGITTFFSGQCDGTNTPDPSDKCCHEIDLKNNWGPDIIEVELNMIDPNWIFNTIQIDPLLDFGFCGGPFNGTLCIRGQGNTPIPSGVTSAALATCFAQLDSLAGGIPTVEIKWKQLVGEEEMLVVCRDTLLIDCDIAIPDTCMTVLNKEIRCLVETDSPLDYEFCFDVENNSGVDVSDVTLECLDPGFFFGPICVNSLKVNTIPDPLTTGTTTTTQICVIVKSSIPILAPTNLCMKMGLIASDGSECCHSPVSVCVDIEPCCDPCTANAVIVDELSIGTDECCYSVGIVNECEMPYFTKFEAVINIPGVCFGSHVINSAHVADWIVTSTPDKICLEPSNLSGTISGSYSNLLDFCLDKITSATSNPVITFNWYAFNSITEQNEIVCTDTYKTSCEDSDNECVIVTEGEVACLQDSMKYRYTFSITNTSSPAFTADKLHLEVKNDPSFLAVPSGVIMPLVPALGPGETRTITTCIAGPSFPAPFPDFVFGYRLQDMVTGDCCYESKCDTIPIPLCNIDCCDVTEEEFYSYFDDLIAPTSLQTSGSDCEACFDFSNIENCDQFGISINGEPFLTPEPEVGCWDLNLGSNTICFEISRWTGSMAGQGDICFEKDTCITIVCSEPVCPACPNGIAGTNLIVNGDFESGGFATNFTSDYTNFASTLSPGQADVRRNGTLLNPNWSAFDHTTGSPAGSFLVADGPNPNAAIWRSEVLTVIPGRTYYFCAWVDNLVIPDLVDISDPMVEVFLNGTTIIINPTAVSQLPDGWVLITGSYLATSTTAQIEIYNRQANGFSDLAIDDISFMDCGEICVPEEPCLIVTDTDSKEMMCEVDDCYANPLCQIWLRQLLDASTNAGCQFVIDYASFHRATWNGQTVFVGFKNGAPDGGSQDVFSCDGTLLQSCTQGVGPPSCSPDADIDLSTDLVNFNQFWSCGEVLPELADCGIRAACQMDDFCNQWIIDYITDNNSLCSGLSLETFSSAVWMGQTVYVARGSVVPDAGFEIVFDCKGNTIQTCNLTIAGPICTPDMATLDVLGGLSGEAVLWTCGDSLPVISSPCVPDPSISCTEYCITVKNNVSPARPINQIQLFPQNSGVSVSPCQVSFTSLNSGQSSTITVVVCGDLEEGDITKVNIETPDSQGEDCCLIADPVCLITPRCTPDTLCCTDFDAFCALVNQGFLVTRDSCNVLTVDAPQFGSCHWFGTSGPDWGDGSITLPVITPAVGAGPWTHTYNNDGSYDICITVFEGEDIDNSCWQKDMCTTVQIDCSCDTTDLCDNIDLGLDDNFTLGECCYTGWIENDGCDNLFKGIRISVSAPASIAQVQTMPGWTITTFTPTEAELYPSSNHIPLGGQDVFTICNRNDGSPLNVTMSWLQQDSKGNCIELCPVSISRDCDEQQYGCVEIVEESTNCELNEYCFRALNVTSPNIDLKSLEFIWESPRGASLTPDIVSLVPPLMTGDTTDWICVNYNTLGQDSMCFVLVGHEADIPAGEPVTWCCTDTTKYFIIDEPCTPVCDPDSISCDDLLVTLVPDPVTGDTCCFVGSIENNFCPDFFKGVKITTTAPVTITSVQGLNGWIINAISSTEAELYPPGTHIPLGQVDIFSGCNDNGTQNPFNVQLSWLYADADGNCTEHCETIFDLSCDGPPPSCLSVVSDSLVCDMDSYCFRIQNNTSPFFPIESIDMIGLQPAGTSVSPNPITVSPALGAGVISDWICIDYIGAVAGDSLCYFVVGHNEDVNMDFPTWCCATSDPHCVLIEDETCLPDSTGLCCTDYDAFCDLVDIGFDLAFTDTTLTVMTTQFDSCHWFSMSEPDWGDGSPLDFTAISAADTVSWTHAYDTTGSYEICIEVYEGNSVDSICWQKDICVDLFFVCKHDILDFNPCGPSVMNVPTGFSPNGDGFNDVLIISGPSACTPIDIRVFNRWGQIVFEQSDYDNTWDGKSNRNEELPEGTYYLIVDFHRVENQRLTYQKYAMYLDLRRQ